MELFPVVLMFVAYLGVIGFFIYLTLRFIRAHEHIAEAIERHLNKVPL